MPRPAADAAAAGRYAAPLSDVIFKQTEAFKGPVAGGARADEENGWPPSSRAAGAHHRIQHQLQGTYGALRRPDRQGQYSAGDRTGAAGGDDATRAMALDSRVTHDELKTCASAPRPSSAEVAKLQEELTAPARRRHDPLTGSLNRKRPDEAVEREIAWRPPPGSSLCLALLDVDNFKTINDRLGHAGATQPRGALGTGHARSHAAAGPVGPLWRRRVRDRCPTPRSKPVWRP